MYRKAENICADQPVNFIFRLRQSGGGLPVIRNVRVSLTLHTAAEPRAMRSVIAGSDMIAKSMCTAIFREFVPQRPSVTARTVLNQFRDSRQPYSGLSAGSSGTGPLSLKRGRVW
jgi:hypothetical protein